MVPPAAPSAEAAPQLPRTSGNIAQRLALSFLLVFLFFVYSRILDYVLSSLHIPLIVSVLTLVFATLSGGLHRIFLSRAGLFLTAFLGWMVICVPLAFWVGGSVQFLQEYVKSFLVFALIIACLRRSRHVMYAGYAIAVALLGVIGLCLTLGVIDQFGRLKLPSGLLGNSNDLAQVILIGIPFWILFGNGSNGVSLRPLISAGVILALLVLMMKTGSRSVMVGAAAVAGLSFLRASMVNKIKLAVVGTVGVAILLVAMPGALRDRYGTIFSGSSSDSETGASAVASTSQRTELFKRSMAMTLRHPVFGVGPGNFQPASAAAYGNQLGSAWFETHNTMTQISSEMGIPGLLFFCGALLYAFRYVWRLARWKPAPGQTVSPAAAEHVRLINRIGECLLLSLASLTLTSLFSSIAYHIFFPTLLGLCVALDLTAGEELRILFPRRPPAVPNPSPYTAPPMPGQIRGVRTA